MLKWGLIGAVGIVGVYALTYLAGPEMDNVLKIRTAADTRRLQNLRIGDRRLLELVQARYGNTKWSAHHHDEIFLTTINCEARDAGRDVLLTWEVGHGYSPNAKIAARDFFVCPLTRAAAEITPAFVPPGLPLAEYPTTPTMRSMALYGWASKAWTNNDPTKLNIIRNDRPRS